MSALEIILSFLTTVLAGSNLFTLLTIKSAKQKESNSVEKSNVDLATDAVNNMLESVNKLMDKNKEYTEIIMAKNDELSLMRSEKEDNGKRIASLENRLNTLQAIFAQVIEIIEGMPVSENSEKQIKQLQKLIKESGCKDL